MFLFLHVACCMKNEPNMSLAFIYILSDVPGLSEKVFGKYKVNLYQLQCFLRINGYV